MGKSFDLSSADGQHQLDLFLDGFLKDNSTHKEPSKSVKTTTSTPKSTKTTATDLKSKIEAISKPTPKPQTEQKAKVIEFPKPVPDIDIKRVSGSATYEDCKRKMKKELDLFKDADSEYVINGLLELCKVDENFRNCVMQKEKSFSGAFDYMAQQARQGIGAYKVGNSGAIMEKDTALGICINYYES
jgi:hypothetical protein